jgi:hypothetical protein
VAVPGGNDVTKPLIWFEHIHRPTHDLDLLGFGDSSAGALAAVFHDACTVNVEPDGLVFDSESISVAEIREDQEYGGQRVRPLARLANARIPLQVDIGFGDALVPAPDSVVYPSLLGFPTPRLRIYRRETVVAEKLHAMFEHGSLNSRMKDFYDLWIMCRRFAFDGFTLSQAVAATFHNRGIQIAPEEPLPLSRDFAQMPVRVSLWQGFLNRHEIALPDVSFADVVAELNRFLMPIVMAVATGQERDAIWPPGGPWQDNAGGEPNV